MRKTRSAQTAFPSSARGLTLVEVAICILIIGLTLASAVRMHNQSEQQKKMDVTAARMDALVQSLSIYAETAGRVPCPADPSVTDLMFGWERGIDTDADGVTTEADLNVGTGRFPVGSCGTLVAGAPVPPPAVPGPVDPVMGSFLPGPTEGIVPYMTLGLSPEAARDGWGNYFTYAVSPVFARRNDHSNLTLSTDVDTGGVHGRCRHVGWTNDVNTSTNMNPVKARFCCADMNTPTFFPADDLVIRHTDNVTVLSPVRADPDAGNYGYDPAAAPPPPYKKVGAKNYTELNNSNINKTIFKLDGGVNVPVAADPANIITAPAFVLVSHGPDGAGAYLGNGTLNRAVPLAGAAGTLEAENADGDQVFIDGPWATAGNSTGPAYFDDVVRWMTQDGLLAAHGAISCQYP